MAVKIRLKRTGAKNSPCYRIIVIDGRQQRDGRAIEELGFYDPCHSNEKLDVERAEYWISKGAQPSETVKDIIERSKAGKELTVPEKKGQDQTPKKKVVESKEEAPQEQAEEAPAEEAPAEEAKEEVAENA